MCGITYVKKLDGSSAKEQLLGRYEFQKLRGQEGFGYVAVRDGVMIAYDRSETEKEIKEKLAAVPFADEIMFHHRNPTSTPNFSAAAHPILVSNGKLACDYYVVHNGIISDDEDYKYFHNEEGYTYTTEMMSAWLVGGVLRDQVTQWNDSEALAIELAMDIDSGRVKGIGCMGSISFVAMQINKKTKEVVQTFWGTNGSMPLKAHFVDGAFLAVHSEGTGENCKPHTLYWYDHAKKETYELPYRVGNKAVSNNIVRAVPLPERNLADVISFGAGYEGEDYPEMPDNYYVLCEEANTLREQIKSLDSQNIDTIALEIDLEILQTDIKKLEDEFDKQQAVKSY